MTVTFTTAADVEQLLEEHLRTTNDSMEFVVNELLRQALHPNTRFKNPGGYEVQALSLKFAPGIDPNRLSEIAQEMEDEEIIRKHHNP